MSDLVRRLEKLSPAKRAAFEEMLRKTAHQDQPRDAIVARSACARTELSFAEQRLWFLNQFEPEHPFYNMPMAARLAGPLDAASFEQCLHQLVGRHETLRTTYPAVGGHPSRRIAPRAELPIEHVDLQTLPRQQREEELQRHIRREARRPFDLAKGPLLRTVIYRLDQQQHVVLLAMHHIICDGWSMAVMLRELAELYEAAFAARQPRLSPLPIQYGDFALWQRERLTGKLFDEQFEYWRRQLGDEPPVLNLPTDRPRAASAQFDGATRPVVLSPQLTTGLRELSRRQGSTLFMTLLAAYNVLLSRWSLQDDICVGTVVANRTRSELEELIGFFGNTLVLRTDLSGDPTFGQLLGQVREVTLGAYAHQDLPFEKLVERLQPQRHGSHAPLFQAALVLQNAPLALPTNSGLVIEPLAIDNGTAKYDLTCFFTEQQDRLVGHIEYQAALFDGQSIDRLINAFTVLLSDVIDHPEVSISQLRLLDAAGRRQVVTEWNANKLAEEPPHCLHQLVESHAARRPDNIALHYNQRQVKYGQFDRQANRVARRLASLGVKAESLVGVCLERSIELAVGVLGVMKAGGAYVPIDPDQPARRIRFLVDDSNARIVLTRRSYARHLAGVDARIVLIEELLEADDETTDQPVSAEVGRRNLAYVVYTSGSMGRPKGVLVEHGNIVNFVRAETQLLGIEANDRVLQALSPGFDGSICEMFVALANGACLVIADRETAMAADALQRLLKQQRVTAMEIVPSLLELLRPEDLPELRVVVSVGESLSAELAARWAPGRRFFNGYGPTEGTVGVCLQEVDTPVERRPPIGRPLANMQVYILDRHQQPLPVGVPGEIVIGGLGVARGYQNNPALTAERFIADCLSGRPGARLYRTGDLGRWLPDGTVEFLGRIDDQVKIRGFRIEPGEIASVLQESPDVDQAVVVACDRDTPSPRLVAYVVPGREASGDAGQGANDRARQHVAGWQALFADMHRQVPPPDDPAFDITGWVSSYTAQPIPTDEMRQWVDRTVQQILALQPQRVLEVGCGTGLILARVAPHCNLYVGTDFNPESLGRLSSLVRQRDDLHQRVQLLQRTADNLDDLEPGSFDLLVLNSVAQYFPSIEYLLRVLEGMVRLLRPGGQLFLGDLRSLPLQAALSTSIELARAENQVDTAVLRGRVRARLEREEELLIDSALFDVLRSRLPRLGRIDVRLKRGTDDNELTRFRYDVVLHFDRPQPRASGDIVDWSAIAGDPASIARRLRDLAPDALTLRGVPNARVAADAEAWRLLQEEDAPPTAGELRTAARRAVVATAIDPEAYWKLADQLPYTVDIGWTDSGAEGRYDVVFRRTESPQEPQESAGGIAGGLPPGDGLNGVPRPEKPDDWSRLANRPLAGGLARQVLPRLRAYLETRLPEYMIPAAFVTLDALPRTARGKIDFRALPPPPSDRPDWSGSYVAPRNENESLVAGIWEELLGVKPIGTTDDFFALGGHSMLAVQVMAEIEKASGRKLPLSVLFQQPTVARLAELLSLPEEQYSRSLLVPIQPTGSLAPWFFIHPAGGTVFCYRRLAELLPDDRPLIGIQALGLDGHHPPHTRIEEMALCYVEAIRKHQPHGPYLLGGWSLGGNVAYEMARQLVEQGEEVDLLALLDAGAIGPERAASEEEFLPLLIGLFPAEDQLPLEELRKLAPDEQLQYFIERAERAQLVLPGDDATQSTRQVFEVFQANTRAISEYQPQPYPGKVTLLRASQQALHLDGDATLGWNRLAAGGVEVHEIPGDHVHMITDPNVAAVARCLEDCLQRLV